MWCMTESEIQRGLARIEAKYDALAREIASGFAQWERGAASKRKGKRAGVPKSRERKQRRNALKAPKSGHRKCQKQRENRFRPIKNHQKTQCF